MAKPREYPLDCGHSVWYSRYPPRSGDTVLCRKCDQYRGVVTVGKGVILENDYLRESNGKNYVGTCVYEYPCEYQATRGSAKELALAMQRHIAFTHGCTTLLRETDGTLTPAPTGDVPPF